MAVTICGEQEMHNFLPRKSWGADAGSKKSVGDRLQLGVLRKTEFTRYDCLHYADVIEKVDRRISKPVRTFTHLWRNVMTYQATHGLLCNPMHPSHSTWQRCMMKVAQADGFLWKIWSILDEKRWLWKRTPNGIFLRKRRLRFFPWPSEMGWCRASLQSLVHLWSTNKFGQMKSEQTRSP